MQAVDKLQTNSIHRMQSKTRRTPSSNIEPADITFVTEIIYRERTKCGAPGVGEERQEALVRVGRATHLNFKFSASSEMIDNPRCRKIERRLFPPIRPF